MSGKKILVKFYASCDFSNFVSKINVGAGSTACTSLLTHSHTTKFWTRPNSKHMQMTN